MVIYWCEEVRGVIGLAVDGPKKGSRITKAAKWIQIRTKVECVIPCYDEAAKEFEKGMWEK